MKDDDSFEDLTQSSDAEQLVKNMVHHMNPHVSAALRKLPGYVCTGTLECDRCRRKLATRNRQRTSYVDGESNWATLCPDCQEEADEYWEEMWKEYYSSRM
jgi:hypothetical protein